MFAISPTDYNWYNYLKSNNLNSDINFWTPTPWKVSNLKNGSYLYFMLKSPIRKIGGYGEFEEYKTISVDDAWNEFGYRNGVSTKHEFVASIKNYIEKRSKKFSTFNSKDYKIGSIVLKNCEFWDESDYINISQYNISFPKQVVTIKYYYQQSPFHATNSFEKFELLNEPREIYQTLTSNRKGQSIFKSRISKAYNNQCCISRETIPELLEAAHIQKYKNLNSNHIQNGLLLRVDLHRLYDNNLIYIDENYTIKISKFIDNEQYKIYNGKQILLPSNINDYPSKKALHNRKSDFRE